MFVKGAKFPKWGPNFLGNLAPRGPYFLGNLARGGANFRGGQISCDSGTSSKSAEFLRNNKDLVYLNAVKGIGLQNSKTYLRAGLARTKTEFL